MSEIKPTYQQLKERLAEIEPVIEALKHHEVDAVVGEGKIAFLLLQGVETTLLKSEQEFRAMFDLSGVGMVQADAPALRFTRVNPKLCAITGYSADDLLTKTWLELTYPGDRGRDIRVLTEVLRGKIDSWSIEKRCVRKDRSLIWVNVNGTALRDNTGRVVKIMAMIEDITSRKQSDKSSATSSKLNRRKKTPVKDIRKSVSPKASGKSQRSGR
jgi:PAS domain S-box-containing protein